MIGGVDVILRVRNDVPVMDIIWNTAQRHWPHLVFQDADDDVPFSADPRPQSSGSSGELFLYRDEKAALSWDELGADPENFNTMLHVLIGENDDEGPGFTALTLVCDELSGEMKNMIEEIEKHAKEFVRNAKEAG